MDCNKHHIETDKIVKDLPINQGGIGRHKCASCAFEKGYENGKNHIVDFNINDFISNLDRSQKGLHRHRDPIEAYELGYYHGQVEAGNHLTIQNKKGIAFSMRNYGLTIIAKSILNILKEDNLPYAHATNVVNIAHGFEILVKARIVEQHPLLIFDKISNNEKIKEGDLEFEDLLQNGRTIEYSKLPYQLWAATGNKITNIDLYNKFGKIRNQIIHFHVPMEISLSIEALKYSFEIIEKCVNEWWSNYTIFKYIKVFDYHLETYKKIFDKLEELNLTTKYKFCPKHRYILK